MTYEQACDVFVKHSQFFELYATQLYIPRGCETIIDEITLAYKAINTGYVCTTCGNEMIIDANRHRMKRIKDLENLKHYTFPKHD